jgi:hypothetical protein
MACLHTRQKEDEEQFRGRRNEVKMMASEWVMLLSLTESALQ